MFGSKISSVVFGFSFLMLGTLGTLGCGAPLQEHEDEDEVEELEQGLEWVNGNSPSFFWEPSTQAQLRALAHGPLLDANGDLVHTPLASSAGGRSFLRYLIGCALPEGVTVDSPSAGVSFAGAIGLAPEWASSSLSGVASQRWVTACLLQTLNGLQAQVAIRMSGTNPALADEPGTDVSAYTVAEATMFGNLFLSNGGTAYACTDAGLITGCGIQASSSMLQRICGVSPTCGLTLLGPCSLHCNEGSSGVTCNDQSASSYAETISTTLQSSVAAQLHPVCLF
ncbi:MAG TPA: hypothetical protein VLS89_15300 [Candidatus Nanopelagicales bacterium]|nr:hypothetical protein [Candidatus Nanopelagicales bacterium]